jgi:hypothetical protein
MAARLALDKYRRDGLRSVIHVALRRGKRSVFRNTLFKHLTVLRYKRQQHLYDAPAHPYKIIEVRTDQVTHFNKAIRAHWGLGMIKGGDWDRPENCEPIRKTNHYRGLEQRFEEGLNWEHTNYYQRKIQNDLSQEVTDKRSKRVEYFEQLFNDIKRNGYRPNYESGHNAPGGGTRQGRLRCVHALEPIVTIGRKGDIYLNEGFHRIAIAKYLGIEKIPVHVLARHEKWQEIRERIHNTSDVDSDPEIQQYLSHPDINDVVGAFEPKIKRPQ